MHFFHKQQNTNHKFQRQFYSLRNVHADRVLDVAQDGPNVGTTILWEGYGGDNQTFTVIQEGPDYYLRCKKNGQFLTVESAANGAKVFLSAKNGQANQKFRIDPSHHKPKDYVIYTYCGKALDVL